MQTIIKPTVDHPDAALMWPSRIIAKFRAAMAIPIGYQDETRFHLGSEPFVTEALPPLGFKLEIERRGFPSYLDDAVARGVADQVSK